MEEINAAWGLNSRAGFAGGSEAGSPIPLVRSSGEQGRGGLSPPVPFNQIAEHL